MQKIITDQITVDDLTDRLAEVVIQRILEVLPKPESPEKYLTRKETAELLSISLVTLNKWGKKDYLKPRRIGNRVRFLKSEIEEMMKNAGHAKFQRD